MGPFREILTEQHASGLTTFLIVIGGIILLVATLLLLLGIFGRLASYDKKTIYQYHTGLLYTDGKFIKELKPGRYRVNKNRDVITTYDLREKLLSLPGQEVLTADNISLKLSLAGSYKLVDAVKAAHEVETYASAAYQVAQQILRGLVSTMTLEALLADRDALDAALLEKSAPAFEGLGLVLLTLGVRDIMLPGPLKRAFSGVLEARKEAERQLEKARGEQAVLRSLANAAKVYETHPMLLQARLIQSVSSGNNQIIFNPGHGAAGEPPA